MERVNDLFDTSFIRALNLFLRSFPHNLIPSTNPYCLKPIHTWFSFNKIFKAQHSDHCRYPWLFIFANKKWDVILIFLSRRENCDMRSFYDDWNPTLDSVLIKIWRRLFQQEYGLLPTKGSVWKSTTPWMVLMWWLWRLRSLISFHLQVEDSGKPVI